MKDIKYKELWALDVNVNAGVFHNEMIQVFTSKLKKECIEESKKWKGKKVILKRKVLTDKY